MRRRFEPIADNRHSIRLPDFDYRSAGVYFVTVCTHRRKCVLGDVVHGRVRLTASGQIVDECWRSIPTHFPGVTLDQWIVMPNHVHGIILLDEVPTDIAAVGATHASPLPYLVPSSIYEDKSPFPAGPLPQSIGAIVGAFKSAATRRINSVRRMSGVSIWQRNYHEHVIRNDASLERFRRYIMENPARWEAGTPRSQ